MRSVRHVTEKVRGGVAGEGPTLAQMEKLLKPFSIKFRQTVDQQGGPPGAPALAPGLPWGTNGRSTAASSRVSSDDLTVPVPEGANGVTLAKGWSPPTQGLGDLPKAARAGSPGLPPLPPHRPQPSG